MAFDAAWSAVNRDEQEEVDCSKGASKSEIFRKMPPPPIGMNWQLHNGPGIFFGFFWAVLLCSLICFCACFFSKWKVSEGCCIYRFICC